MGSLHEANPSLWIGTTEATRFHELHSDMEVDVVVVGAGITGLTSAALLKEQGRRVAVVEAGRVESGVTGYTTAKLPAVAAAARAGELSAQQAAAVAAAASAVSRLLTIA